MKREYFINPQTERKLIQAEERGEKNEQRAFDLALNLTNILKEKYPQIVLFAYCTRSENYSRKDRKGEDIRIRIESVAGGNTKEHGYIVYDVKSSDYGANLKNTADAKFSSYVNAKRKAGNIKNARLSKTLVVNENRTDFEIQEQILNDLKEVNLLPDSIDL